MICGADGGCEGAGSNLLPDCVLALEAGIRRDEAIVLLFELGWGAGAGLWVPLGVFDVWFESR